MNPVDQTQLYLTILNKVKDGIIAVDSNGYLLFYNNAAESMISFPKNSKRLEWIDQFELHKIENKGKLHTRNHPVLRALRDERITNEEYTLSPKNKIPRPVLISTHTLIKGGIKEGAIIILNDISQQKETEKKLNSRSKSLIQAYEGLRKAEAGLKVTNAELEKRVLERTQNLTKINKELHAEIQIRLKAEKQIKQNNNELLKTNRDLDNFVYTASHDLKAPISNIEGLINVLKEETIDNHTGIKEIIDLISLSVEKFKFTIADLTEISKIQKGDGEDDIEELKFEEIFTHIQSSIHELIKISEAKIKTNFNAAPSINFSRKNLQSIFYNLISNAIKYKHGDRKPEIRITTEANSRYCILTISDNGIGIPNEKKNQIFNMFKRLHDHVEGSGIGLYLVKRIMDNAEGKIEVESVVGKGSEFKLYFPKM